MGKTMKTPKISIIIPVYNEEKRLAKCISSVLNQTYKDYELIFVDNNSNDKSKQIVLDSKKNDQRIKYLFESKQGRGAARYKGEINAKGDIIVMTDADCIAPKNWLKKLISPIIKNKKIAVQGITRPIIKNYWTLCWQDEYEKWLQRQIDGKHIDILDTANFAIKRDILKKIGFSNPNIDRSNDTELKERLLINNYKIFFNPLSIIFHYNKESFKEIFEKRFNEGKYESRIYKRYGSKKGSKEHICSFIDFFLISLKDLFSLKKTSKYMLTVRISNKLGRIYGKFKIK